MSRENVLRLLQKSAKEISQILKIKNRTMEVFLVNDRFMRTLKKRFFHRNKSADVLSFAEPDFFPHPESKKKALGEIYLNWDMHRKNPERTTFLLAHGVLHLLGYDHFKKNDIIRMERKEKEIMKRLRVLNIRN